MTDLNAAIAGSKRLRDKYKQMHTAKKVVVDETDQALKKFEDMVVTCTTYMRDSVTSGNKSPRPDWTEAKEVLSVGMELDSSLPSAEIGGQLVTNIKMMKVEYAKAMEAQAKLIAEGFNFDAPSSPKKEDANDDSPKWFVCKGTGPQVPEFLRATGKVRNKRLRKAKTEELLGEFWAAKIAVDEDADARAKLSVQHYLFRFLLAGQDGNQRAAVEMGYNLVDALKRYSYDADCEIFHQILFDELPEEAYHRQMVLLEDFVRSCKATEAKLADPDVAAAAAAGGEAAAGGGVAAEASPASAPAPAPALAAALSLVLDRANFMEVIDRNFPSARSPFGRGVHK